jgi:dCMP deaminase
MIRIDEYGIDNLGRPCKDLYCMNLCFEIARRSLDPTTKHGCLAVSPEGSILSSGYNGPPQNSIDDRIPLTRPEKYVFMEHSERNCIYMASRNGVCLSNSIFYITGFPCTDCLRAMIQVKVSKIVYGPYNSVMTNSLEYIEKTKSILVGQKIIVKRFAYDEGLYKFNPRVKELIESRKINDINFEWNVIDSGM